MPIDIIYISVLALSVLLNMWTATKIVGATNRRALEESERASRTASASAMLVAELESRVRLNMQLQLNDLLKIQEVIAASFDVPLERLRTPREQ